MAAPLVLASASPRRRRLLEQLGVAVEVRPAGVPEEDADGPVPERVLTLAHLKAAAVAAEMDDGFVLAADTLGALDGVALGKPRGAQEAMQMLWRMADRTHDVFTGVVALRVEGGRIVREATDVVCTKVTFRPLTVGQLRDYLATEDYEDKAGGYGIQGAGRALVAGLDGPYTNVVGLPVAATLRLLAELGYPIPETDPEAAERRLDAFQGTATEARR